MDMKKAEVLLGKITLLGENYKIEQERIGNDYDKAKHLSDQYRSEHQKLLDEYEKLLENL